MVEHLPSMQKSLRSIPSTGKEGRKGLEEGGREGRERQTDMNITWKDEY